ncbi:MAG: DUF1592 domain-containing protein [Planctomycetota bacterium]
MEKDGLEGFGVTGITIRRVFPEGDKDHIQRQLFGTGSDKDIAALFADEAAWSEKHDAIVRRFADRAFRRPTGGQTVRPYLELARDEAESTGDTLAGVRAAYRAILCSPRFLTFVEPVGKLDDHALASRLSYMIWNSMPDERLRSLADEGKLSDWKTRQAELRRLLADAKSERFIESFADQWLQLAEINFTSPDRKRFRTFDPVVQQSMLEETRDFVAHLIRTDASVENLIRSDFSFLNERLARFYGLDDLALEPGGGVQKVSLNDPVRGGLVTHGSVLKVTADGTSTSPIVRGVWVAERILGVHIPPPPPGIPAVEPDIRGAVSIRDQLAKHTSSEDCSACHAKFDPAGFVLENFDPVGLWRTTYGREGEGAKVDPSGVTLDGVDFARIDEWKAIYGERKDLLASGFAKKLLVYATGADLRFSDRAAMDKILERAAAKDYGMQSIIHAVVASPIFRYK